jgi:hypothetical protein
MNQLLRNLGFGLMVGGVVMVLIWAIKPLRMVWPWLLQRTDSPGRMEARSSVNEVTTFGRSWHGRPKH